MNKNKYNRLREDPSQLQKFGDEVIDFINNNVKVTVNIDISQNHDATVETLLTALGVDAEHSFEGPVNLTYFRNGTYTAEFSNLKAERIYGGSYLQFKADEPISMVTINPPYYIVGKQIAINGSYSSTKNITIADMFASPYLKEVKAKEVIANPTLAGTETELTGLQIGSGKYKVAGGTKLYKHEIMTSGNRVELISTKETFTFDVTNNSITREDAQSIIGDINGTVYFVRVIEIQGPSNYYRIYKFDISNGSWNTTGSLFTINNSTTDTVTAL